MWLMDYQSSPLSIQRSTHFVPGPNLVNSSSPWTPEYNCDHSDIKTNNGPPPFLTRLAPWHPPGHSVVTAPARSGPGGRLLTFDDPAGGTAPAPAPHRNTQDSKQMFSWVRTFLVSGHIRQWMSWESYFIRIKFDWKWTLVPKIPKNISLIGGVIQ